jgi:hypothetical protein
MAINGKTFIRGFLLFVLVVLYGRVIYAGEYKFCYNMKKGDVYKYKYTATNNSVSDYDGKKKYDGGVMTLIFTITIDDISTRGNFVCTARIDSFSWDINNEDSKTSGDVYSKFIGKRVKLTLSPDGKTLNSVPMDNVEIPQPGIKTAVKPAISPANIMNFPKWILPEDKLKMNRQVKKTHIDTNWNTELNSTSIVKTITEYNLCGSKKIGQYNCMKILITITEIGTYKGLFKGIAMNSTSNTKKKIISYFAPAEGILVQSSENEGSILDAIVVDKGQRSVSKNNHTGKSNFLLLR